MSGLRELRRQGARYHDGVASACRRLFGEGVEVERVMQHQRPADQQPRQQRGRERSERGEGQRCVDAGMLLDSAFELDRETAGDQFGMAARDRNGTRLRDVPGDHGEMLAWSRRAGALAVDRRKGIARRGGIVERKHAVRRIGAETEDVADRKHLDGGLHRKIIVVDASDAAAHDQRRGGDAGERGDHLGTPP